MSKPKGLRVGRYRITPLGLTTLAVLLVLILGGAGMAIFNPFGGPDSPFAPEPTPTPTIDPATITPTPTPAPTPTPSPTPEPQPRSARIRSLGEIAMQTNLLKAATTDGGQTFDFSDMFSYISEVMGNADYTVADVEGTMGGKAKLSGGDKMITPPILIQNLKDCGVDMLMVANDHALDGGFDEEQAMLANIRAAGMDYVGGATSADEKKRPVIKSINGINVAFLAYTDTLHGREKKTSSDAKKFGVNLVTRSNPAKEVQAARDAGADIVVVYMSWGKMFKRDVTDDQKKIGQQFIKAGADVIIGYGPHVVQPIMWADAPADKSGNIHRTLVACATGNFLSDQREQYADSGIIFEFTIRETAPGSGKYAIVNPVYIPTYVWRSQGETDGSYTYRTVACGQWLEEQPEGMSYGTDVTRMRAVWAEVQSVIGADIATVAAE